MAKLLPWLLRRSKKGKQMLTTNHNVVIALPLNLLYTVRLASKQKLGIAAVFSLGIIIILVAIARAIQISRKSFTDGVLLALWGIIESTVCKFSRPIERFVITWAIPYLILTCDIFLRTSCHSRMPSSIQVAFQSQWVLPAPQLPKVQSYHATGLRSWSPTTWQCWDQ